ncbi:LexA family transcriptional regulator [Rhizobium leguminosarum]|uniref:LexA family transcriptional regulator n=1 Tax=Rhizobium leguminosarum TaxID=384 RepID=UPI0003735F6E|nr:helix-turn-helix transcriptional regulator [Rhizobium leguminosarum]
MADDIEIGQRLKAARLAAGFKTAKAAAESLGVPYPTYSQHENGTRGIVREADLYARRYKISLDWLMRAKGDGPMVDDLTINSPEGPTHIQIKSGSKTTKPNASFPPRYQAFPGDQSLPLLGQTVAGPNGRFVLNGTEVGRVFTPPMLEGVEGAYAVRVYGTSMEPRYYAGETVWLNPHEPVRQGDDVVVQIITDEENGRESYIKRFISKSAKATRLWQHNPDEGERNELEFETDKVFSVHKIVFHATV